MLTPHACVLPLYLPPCRPSIEKILNFLPRKGQRQALLFSATFPQDVQDLARFALQVRVQAVGCVLYACLCCAERHGGSLTLSETLPLPDMAPSSILGTLGARKTPCSYAPSSSRHMQAPWQVVDTVGEDTHTNVQVVQQQQVVPFADQFFYLVGVMGQSSEHRVRRGCEHMKLTWRK